MLELMHHLATSLITKVMRLIIYSILILAAIGFLTGLILSISYSLDDNAGEMPAFLIQIVTVIGGVLATNFGAVVGMKISTQSSIFNFYSNSKIDLQLIAAYLYFLGLTIALGGWALLQFDEIPGKVVEILPQMSRTLLGVAAGVLAVRLGQTHE